MAELTLNNTANTFSLTNDWLNTNTVSTNYIDTWRNWTNPTVTTTYWCGCNHYCSCSGKVRLSLKEVDVLRRAAKKDSKLKDILERLTNKIEVEVSFDG